MRTALALTWILIFVAGADECLAGGLAHDALWWTTLSREEKIGYFQGNHDCYVYDVRKGYYYDGGGANIEELVGQIDAYYRNHSAGKKISVQRIIRQLEAHGHVRTYTKAQQFDGVFWGQFSVKTEYAFVDGYLDCRKAYFSDKIVSPTDEYVSLINRRYNESDANVSERVGSIIDSRISLAPR